MKSKKKSAELTPQKVRRASFRIGYQIDTLFVGFIVSQHKILCKPPGGIKRYTNSEHGIGAFIERDCERRIVVTNIPPGGLRTKRVYNIIQHENAPAWRQPKPGRANPNREIKAGTDSIHHPAEKRKENFYYEENSLRSFGSYDAFVLCGL